MVKGLEDLKLRIRALKAGSVLDQIENVGKTLAQTRGDGKKIRGNVDLACLGEDQGAPQFFLKNKLGGIYVSGVGSYLGMTRAKVWHNQGYGINVDAGATATIYGDLNEVADNAGVPAPCPCIVITTVNLDSLGGCGQRRGWCLLHGRAESSMAQGHGRLSSHYIAHMSMVIATNLHRGGDGGSRSWEAPGGVSLIRVPNTRSPRCWFTTECLSRGMGQEA